MESKYNPYLPSNAFLDPLNFGQQDKRALRYDSDDNGDQSFDLKNWKRKIEENTENKSAYRPTKHRYGGLLTYSATREGPGICEVLQLNPCSICNWNTERTFAM